MNVFISGSGHFLPEKIISNSDIVKKMNTSEEFILQRTGVQSRRHIEESQSLKSIMVPACQAAIADACLLPSDIDMLIVNTLSPDHHDPSQACLIQPLLGLRNVPCFDIRAQCSGLIFGIDLARQFIANGSHKHILITCGEVLSKRMDVSDEGRNLSILLGDGAGAIVLSASEREGGIMDVITGSDGSYYKLLWTQSPGSANKTYSGEADASNEFRMNGRPMFDHAVQKITEVCKQILTRNHLSVNDIDIIIPHQPNLRILDAVREELGIPESQMWINVYKYGNMASASLPIALSEFLHSDQEERSKTCLILGYGSGATWGAVLYKINKNVG